VDEDQHALVVDVEDRSGSNFSDRLQGNEST